MTYDNRFSRLALHDLEEIWLYTFQNWSADQADRYFNDIQEEVERICQNPHLGRSISDIKPGHRMHPVGSHLIVYKIHQSTILVDRILHKHMDIGNRLDG